MLPQLRAAIGDLSIRERVALATVVTCNSGGAVADPGVRSGIRLSFIDPEPGDEPHSALVRVIAAAGWTQVDTAEVSLAMWQLGEHHPRPQFWTALAHEVAAAGDAATHRVTPVTPVVVYGSSQQPTPSSSVKLRCTALTVGPPGAPGGF